MSRQKRLGAYTTEKVLFDNQKTWDIVADLFFEASALPVWGPFRVGDELNLIPQITEKIFLEVACGSGRSINYLVRHGAKAVYGIDISETQLTEAKKYNKEAVETGLVKLFQSPMEQKIEIPPVDVVFSVYGIGWTPEPEKTLANIYSYLVPGGLFIWSWDHAIFSDVVYKNDAFVVEHSYHEETPVVSENWKDREGTVAHITYRKTSTWFQLLIDAGFEVIGYHEPAPKNLEWGSSDPKKYYSIEKAQKVPATFIFVCRKRM
mgnify:CR=1 FL=1